MRKKKPIRAGHEEPLPWPVLLRRIVLLTGLALVGACCCLFIVAAVRCYCRADQWLHAFNVCWLMALPLAALLRGAWMRFRNPATPDW